MIHRVQKRESDELLYLEESVCTGAAISKDEHTDVKSEALIKMCSGVNMFLHLLWQEAKQNNESINYSWKRLATASKRGTCTISPQDAIVSGVLMILLETSAISCKVKAWTPWINSETGFRCP